jgi:hypothetical protein
MYVCIIIIIIISSSSSSSSSTIKICEDLDWIDLAQNTDKWRAIVNAVIIRLCFIHACLM